MAEIQKISKKEGFRRELLDLFPSLFSFDPPTRRMAFVFFMSLVGIFFVLVFSFKRYWAAREVRMIWKANQEIKLLKKRVKNDTEETTRKDSTLDLGSFILELNEVEHPQFRKKVLNLAEVNIVLLCDGLETREYLNSNRIQVRNEMTNLFTSMDRQDLLSREGKKKIKIILMRKINEWLPHGKIQDIYFSKLIVS